MTSIRLCTRRNVIFMDLVEALSKQDRLTPLRPKQQTEGVRDMTGYFTFMLDDQSTMIYVIIDQSTSIPYLLLSGPAAQQAAELMEQTDMIDTIEEVRQWCSKSKDTQDKIDAICRLGIAAYFECRNDILDIFADYIRDPDVRVRQSAVFATSFVGWAEFEPMLKITMERDPDERVSMIAESALRIMRESDWQSKELPSSI